MSRVGELDGMGGTVIMDFNDIADKVADRIVEITEKKLQNRQTIEVLEQIKQEIMNRSYPKIGKINRTFNADGIIDVEDVFRIINKHIGKLH